MKFRPELPRWAIMLGFAAAFVLLFVATQIANAQDSTPTVAPTVSTSELPIIVVTNQILWDIQDNPLNTSCNVSPGISNPVSGSLLTCPTGIGESFKSLGGFWIGHEDYALNERFSVEVPVEMGHNGFSLECDITTGLRPENRDSWRVVIAVYCVAGNNPTLIELGPGIFGEEPEVEATLEVTPTASPEATQESN